MKKVGNFWWTVVLAMAGLALASCGPKVEDPNAGAQPALEHTSAAATADGAGARVNPAAARLEGFDDRVKMYLDARSRADAKVPELKETADPAKIAEREKALGDAIRAERPNAQTGDVFTEPIAAEFRQIIGADFKSRAKPDRVAVLEEVPVSAPPAVNTLYPTDMPLATVPPALLLALPTLPDVLEYRFLGTHLVLRDVKANLIVDVIPGAVPTS
jgi:hypothetical protein